VRVAIIGAGVGGLAAAHRLSTQGHRCDVYERWPGLGGQAATLDVGGGVRLERYYHVALTTDRHLKALYEEIGLPEELEWLRSNVAIFADGQSHAFTSPLDLLRFRPLNVLSRLRMGLALVALQRGMGDPERRERESASAWVRRVMGEACYAKVWGPLLRGKFGDRADDVSMAWLQSKFTVRRQLRGRELKEEVFGYPRGSWETLFTRLRELIEAGGSRVHIDRPAARIGHDGTCFRVTAGAPGSFRRGHDPAAFDVLPEASSYDAVLATVSSPTFEQLLEPELASALAPGYLKRLRQVDYHTALCMLLELDRQFSPFSWMSISDTELPFVGLVEHTSFVDPARYGGRRFLYVANYCDPSDPRLALEPDQLLDLYEPGLRRVNPAYRREWVQGMWLFREPAAQPIVTVGYREQIPPMQTGVPGLVLTNTTQIYPEDRGTNYAIALAERAVAELLSGVGRAGPR